MLSCSSTTDCTGRRDCQCKRAKKARPKALQGEEDDGVTSEVKERGSSRPLPHSCCLANESETRSCLLLLDKQLSQYSDHLNHMGRSALVHVIYVRKEYPEVFNRGHLISSNITPYASPGIRIMHAFPQLHSPSSATLNVRYIIATALEVRLCVVRSSKFEPFCPMSEDNSSFRKGLSICPDNDSCMRV